LSKVVSISGLVTNMKQDKLYLSLPGNSISKRSVELVLEQDGSIQHEFELDCKAGLVDVFTDVDKEPIFKLFVRPGDSISFTCDLEEMEGIQFKGSLELEQYSLNHLIHPSSRRRLQDFDPFFLRYMQVEKKYQDYSDQIWDYSRKSGKQKISSNAILKELSKYLKYTEGYLHDSYKSFVRGYLWVATLSGLNRDIGFLESAEQYLIDWDRYWIKAYWTEQYMESGPGHLEDYHDFADLYPGTPFQQALEKLYKETEKWQVGQKIPKFTCTDLDGKTYKNKKFKNQFWGIITVKGTYQQALGMIKRAIRFNEHEEKQMKFLVWWPNQGVLDTLQMVINDKNMILLAGPEKNVELSEYFKDFPENYLIIDSEYRITTYNIDDLGNLISWPIEKSAEEKTIKLKFFWYSFAGAFILAIVIIFSIRIRAKRKAARLNLKRKIAQLELDAVRSRMNPHFLFNALGSIQNLVNRGKNKEASLYLARFGDLVRTILTQSSKPVIGLNEEIDMIRSYLQLEQLGFPFSFDINIDEKVDPTTIEVPSLLIQPHVENAIIHGISALGKKGKIEIDFFMKEDHLICEVKDNGPGYQNSLKANKDGHGQGWSLTRQRVQLMKEQYGEDISVNIAGGQTEDVDSSEFPGTTVTFRLPFQKSTL